MTALAWDQVGERTYEAGADRGVLYLPDVAVPWNGLTGVEEAFNGEAQAYYLDGTKYLDYYQLGEFGGTLKAFTYPDEFEDVMGVRTETGGLLVHDQQPKPFGLSYRTKLGDDVAGLARGYRIHLLYNLHATPDSLSHNTLADTIAPMEFSWKLTSVPTQGGWGYRATAHLSLKSTDLTVDQLAYLESALYGTSGSEPRLLGLDELVNYLEHPPVVVDNGNGTWTVSSADGNVTAIDATTFKISGANVRYLSLDTYIIKTT